MAILLILLSLPVLGFGLLNYATATTIMQQIAGLISVGTGLALFAWGGIANEIVLLKKKQAELLTEIRNYLEQIKNK